MDQNGLTRIAEEYYRLAKRAVRVVVGFTLLSVGVVLIVLPGPAFIVIPIALAILAGEFVWARRLLRRVKTQVAHYTGYGREEGMGEGPESDRPDAQAGAFSAAEERKPPEGRA